MLDGFVNRVIGRCDADAEFCYEAVESSVAGIVRRSDRGLKTRALRTAALDHSGAT